MKNTFILFLLLFVLTENVLTQDSTNVDEQTGKLILNITGFENNDGSVKIALSNSKEDYETKGQAFKGAIKNISNKSAQHIFDEIPFGIYAIKTFHDENNDGEMDTNFLGIPSEDYGFSNNAKGSFGPASWEDAKFTFDKDSLVVEINIDE